jgi:hypothetical protein
MFSHLVKLVHGIGQPSTKVVERSTSSIEGVERESHDIKVGCGKLALKEDTIIEPVDSSPIPAVGNMDHDLDRRRGGPDTGCCRVEKLREVVESVLRDTSDGPQHAVVDFVPDLEISGLSLSGSVEKETLYLDVLDGYALVLEGQDNVSCVSVRIAWFEALWDAIRALTSRSWC